MKTIALRFSDSFAPHAGTISEHQRVIDYEGYVWYGKLGAAVSEKTCNEILSNDNPKILLIHSGKPFRYWAYVDEISRTCPEYKKIPEYYREKVDRFHTWFRVRKIEKADNHIMSKCFVTSSNSKLSEVSRHSMSPYFIIEYMESV